MRRFVVMLACLAFVAGGAGSAQAHVTEVGTEFGVHKQLPETDRVQMFGEILCTPGETYSLRISIWTEGGSMATGRTSGVCDSGGEVTAQVHSEWVARLKVREGAFGEFDEVSWRIRAMTSDGDVKVETGFAGVFWLGFLP